MGNGSFTGVKWAERGVFNNNPQGSRLGGGPKDRWWNFVQTDINKCEVTNRKERSKNRADWEKSLKEAEVRI